MRVLLSPSHEGFKNGQYAVSVERPVDNLSVNDIVALIVAAMRGYGATQEMIVNGFAAYINNQMVDEVASETTAHC